MERWLKSPWDQPNNGYDFFDQAPDQKAIREAHDLWKTSPAKAFQTYLALAETGCVWSMRQVAKALRRGEGTPVDKTAAEKWLRRGYEAGDEAAMLKLANTYQIEKRYTDAEALLTDYAKKDYAPALYLLAWIFLKTRRKAEARATFERAANLGHHLAKAVLSKLSIQGRFGIRYISYGFRMINEIGEEFVRTDPAVENKMQALQKQATAPTAVS